MSRPTENEIPFLIDPPIEPKLAYPDPPLASDELLALIRGSTFFAATRLGDLMPAGAPHIGLFYVDTRFLSQFQLLINAEEPILLSSTKVGAENSRIELTVRGGPVTGENLDLPINTIYVHRAQLLNNDSFHDHLHIQNFHDVRVKLKVELRFNADFMDIFQVRGLLRGKSGYYLRPQVQGPSVRFCYRGLDNRSRVTELLFHPPPETVEPNRAVWMVSLGSRESMQLVTTVEMHVIEPPEPHQNTIASSTTFEEIQTQQAERHQHWQEDCTRFRSNNKIFDVLLQTSTEDFYALRIPEPAGMAVVAGVPWFAALFGRDSLLSSYETLLLNPNLAKGTLRVLASYQGRERNDERDEDPGKILHERRSGEMTATNEIAFGRSYGSVDATPLFLILAHEYFRWTADRALLQELQISIKAAANWIIDFGDLDGDGLLEYCRRNPKGLFNQGWKDSGDANRHNNGSIAEPPVALVEVQGYAVRALAAASELLDTLGENKLAVRAAARSEELRNLIEDHFWLEDRGYYAMALDRHKQPLRVDGSNPGHLLFSRAIGCERALQTADRLLADGLFSGWGIRTLSSSESYFNPMSYHCGSVWPHDNAIIGYGMARYGLHRQACMVFQSLYDAALHFRDYRLPELFCGVDRQPKCEPVHYPVACSPQAWSAGAPFLILTGLLGLRPSAERGELSIVDPCLPPFLSTLRIDNLRIGSSRLALDFERKGRRTYCNVAAVCGKGLKISIAFASAAR